ncbi:MAG TPA: hypothetical protein VGY56_11875, partial [Verrucomicrobiae bacterium]|nr:hypothetical protein [Verrucomicrobiae bacterium]
MAMKVPVNSNGNSPQRQGRLPRSLRTLTVTAFTLTVLSALFHQGAVEAAIYYVNAANPAPVSPYTSWLTAATNIQDAITMTVDGDTVLVTNGVYNYSGALVGGLNRIAVTNAITVESVNGPWVTTIVGANGGSLVRCAWLTNGAVLAGFTLTGGASS